MKTSLLESDFSILNPKNDTVLIICYIALFVALLVLFLIWRLRHHAKPKYRTVKTYDTKTNKTLWGIEEKNWYGYLFFTTSTNEKEAMSSTEYLNLKDSLKRLNK